MAANAPSLPPGPPLPRAVQTFGFIFTPARFLDACRRRYGDVVTFRTLFDPRFVMVFHPEIVREVLQAPPERLRAGEANVVLGPVVGSRSVLLLDGAEHLRHRKLMLPPFHGRRLAAHEQTMRDAADAAIDAWPVGEEFTLLPWMQSLTLDVILTAVFGVEEGERRTELKRRIRATIDFTPQRLALLMLLLTGRRIGDGEGPMRKFVERREELDELLYDEIARRREATDLDERDDAFSLLLQARDEQGQPLSDVELRDELVTLLVAGHETTATGLAWTFDLLLHSPGVLRRLHEELEAGGGDYVDAVAKEALRMRPVIAGIGRVVRGGAFELNGYAIPEGMEINPNIAGLHRRADRYPQPREFRPERFLGEDRPDNYAWLPFGGGTRRCLGASFALLEMRTVVARIVQRTALEPTHGPEKVSRRGITMVPKHGVRVLQRTPPAAG